MAKPAFSLPFEKPIVDLASRIKQLEKIAHGDKRLVSELKRLEDRADRLAKELFADLSDWQKVQVSRHPLRPYTLDYVQALTEDWMELSGDRAFAEDASIVAGFATFRGRSVAIIGHQKGRGAKDNQKRNFGMPNPEGYRKARRIYELASRFRVPILTFIDTPGAYPGIGAEERGQSEAIGACLAEMARAHVPIIGTIIGEGGSGGALALGVVNHLFVLEYGTYSVISPEGCASILWKDGGKAEEAASRLKITSKDLLRLGIVDAVIEEPPGGAHRNAVLAAKNVGDAIEGALDSLLKFSAKDLVNHRYDRFRKLGVYAEASR